MQTNGGGFVLLFPCAISSVRARIKKIAALSLVFVQAMLWQCGI